MAYGPIARDQSSSGNGPFRCRITADSPVEEVAPLLLDIRADGDYARVDTLDLNLGAVPILFVDDDGLSSYEDYPLRILDRLQYTYHEWNTWRDGPVSADWLGRYETVIWHCGALGNISSYSEQEQMPIAGYLDAGGRLLVAGSSITEALCIYGDASDRQFYHECLDVDHGAHFPRNSR